jgi:starch phosphorylase
VKLIHDAAEIIDADPATSGRLKLIFLPNYGVSEAQLIIPAADLSEQISLAGTEASGTGNMKLSLNGALTVGTLDGANIEIAEAVGRENFFDFGMSVEEVEARRAAGYSPRSFYDTDAELRQVLDMIAQGYFSPGEPDRFGPIVETLLDSDHYMVLGDFRSYLDRQDDIEGLFRDSDAWTRKAILNVARLGHLSSDRAIEEYARNIWAIPGFEGKKTSRLAS